MEVFAYKWFVIGYFLLSGYFTVYGLFLMITPSTIAKKFAVYIESEKAPIPFIRTIRYLFFIGLLSSFLSFFPFKYYHLLYSLWIFMMIFTLGKTLVNWGGFCDYWKAHSDKFELFFQKLGAFFLIIGIATFVLLMYSI
jgi:hypothetical protein